MSAPSTAGGNALGDDLIAGEGQRAFESSLRITEIFSSLQGESSYVGQPTTFVRLTGCPLRCTYCDSAYAFSGGEMWSLDDIAQRCAEFGNRFICVTGGEPLAQPNCVPLLATLCDAGYQVSLETSGALDIAAVDSRVRRIVDVKTPSSGEQSKNLVSNYALLGAHDEIKFVIADRNDFDWSVAQVQQHQLLERAAEVFFSPAFALADASAVSNAEVGSSMMTELAEWILESGLPLRYQLQIHKLIWGDQPGK